MDRSSLIEDYGGPMGIIDDVPSHIFMSDQYAQPKPDDARRAYLYRVKTLEMTYYRRDEEGPDVHDFDSSATYTARELEMMADQLLREDVDPETGEPVLNPETGRPRGIKGQDPILFAEHIRNRQSREILNKTGVPDPGIVRGIYNRTHPDGRKVNSEEARKRHGASYYR